MGQIYQDKIVNGKIEVDGKSSAGLELWQGYNFMQNRWWGAFKGQNYPASIATARSLNEHGVNWNVDS